MSANEALNKKGWEGEEDVRLLELHAAYGPNWTHIARGMGSKSAKQCRERYTQQLRPGLNRSPISEDEGRRIMEMVQESGQRWAQIARNLGTNRSDNQVKNWWNGAKRKETSKRQDAIQNPHQQYPEDFSPVTGFAALPERRGILPPVPLDLPFRQDNGLSSFEMRVRSSSSRSYDSERPPSLVSDTGSSWSISQPPSASSSPTTFSQPCLAPLVSSQQHGDAYASVPRTKVGLDQGHWSVGGYQQSTYSPEYITSTAPTSPVALSHPPAPASFPRDSSLALPPLLLPHNQPPQHSSTPSKQSSFGPIRRSSEVMQQPRGLSPVSRFARTAPATPITRATSSSSRWEPYQTRRPSTHSSLREEEGGVGAKASLSFLLN